MAMAAEQQQLPPSLRCESPSPDLAPSRAIGPVPELSRCLSTASDISHGSGTDFTPRDSLGRSSSDGFSRQSSASYGRRSDVSFASSRQSTCSLLTDRDGARVASRRRGYMRPQGTTFAASAQSRESVLSLGSIAHLQYYFARTGLLDGKGAQLQRKNRQNRGSTLDLSALDDPSGSAAAGASMLSPTMLASDADSSYASMGSSPDLGASSTFAGPLVGSPIDVDDYDDGPYDSDDYDAPDPDMLPPTASTYIHREKPLARPPTIEELKSELSTSLQNASNALEDARNATAGDDSAPGTPSPRRGSAAANTESPRPRSSHHLRHQSKSQGWFEIQGMHILDVMTLAIRAARKYYTAHEHPERLDAIKPERQVRSELFAVMETLKQMATRRWAGGMRPEEINGLDAWLRSLFSMLSQEAILERTERAEREGWTWLSGDWAGKEVERELAFLASLEVGLTLDPLPEYTPARDTTSDAPGPGGETPFLRAFSNGLRLVKLHNAAVKRSKRRFGGITTFHEDTEKPYRCADNLRYWVKAAELRWETHLRIDPLGIVYNTTPSVWADFEDAIFKWCRKVREEISADIVGDTTA
ncbi:hypothetical protein F5X68DRAFT_66437 [Plectosphaerella plurivora]|uniref:Uncharacterized protein n=1 Tax=Plectosphaerella plurivora TaxID=936078 RepID=A0A9P8VGI1_9PEZI|nr:hypothetical protein F5X68DRAFT_66437 [Plectosphaerella plurivora]